MVVSKRISFDDPPIKEVALGRTFLPRDDFLIPYYGAFWTQLRDRFPKAEHAPPIVDPSETFNDGMFLPRVWLISEDSSTLVQLQQNRYHYNWRQTEDKKTYVRFPVIQQECLEIWRKFENFVMEATGQALQPLSAELTYTNFIEVAGASNSFEIAEETLRDSGWASHDRFLSAPKAFAHNYTFSLPGDSGTLQVAAVAAKRKDGKSEALKLELTVKGKCSNDESFEDWSAGAHDFLVQAFKDLTKPSMHQQWKLREE